MARKDNKRKAMPSKKGIKRKAVEEDDDTVMHVNLAEVDAFIDGGSLDQELLEKMDANNKQQSRKKKKKNAPIDDDDEVAGQDEDGLTEEEEKELMLYLKMKQKELRASGGDADEDDEDEDMEGDMEEDVDDAVAAASKRPKWVKQAAVNNVPGMEAHLERIRLPANLPFIETLAVTSTAPLEATLETPEDVHNDTKRELAIYKQALHAATTAKSTLTAASIPFTRPDDYFAEMLKTDAHMARVRQRLLDERLQVEQSEKAKKLRDLKKFGKKVQQSKILERAKSKKATLDAVKLARKKTKNNSSGGSDSKDDGGADEFDIQLEQASGSRSDKSATRNKPNGFTKGGNPRDQAKSKKRTYKDSKYGFGGAKRHSKSNTADSTFSIEKSGFSVKKMKSRAFEQDGRKYNGGGMGANGAQKKKGFKKVVCILNEKAGSNAGKRVFASISQRFRKAFPNFQLWITKYHRHAIELAKDAVETFQADLIVAVGGNGTLSQVVEGYVSANGVEKGCTIGMIPAGSSCDFLKGVLNSNPKGASAAVWDVDFSMSVLTHGVPVALDACKAHTSRPRGQQGHEKGALPVDYTFVNERLYNSPKLRQLSGDSSTHFFLSFLKGFTYRNLPVSITMSDEHNKTMTADCDVYLACLGNNRYFGGGLIPCPRAHPADGVFDVWVAKDVSVIDIVASVLPALQNGTTATKCEGGGGGKRVYQKAARVVARPRSEMPVPVEVDGEYAGILPAEFEMFPKAWRFLLPRASWLA
ncbi:hypothetical protein SmJEL517_g05051 [Synchytrium microbalum]|uniref:DAGKc domain-containing protein n=1 Tax=Synchytrium microbalum TaxID=1806994 RepID=A0A507BVZ1_9FUNG|nr:uncharacterized protein SmJEL517_g05051 [Synchytrium microbalum]TPX31642.1 hypothetical protein SmJEL517_g05051 [Synchytrium microbalum]